MWDISVHISTIVNIKDQLLEVYTQLTINRLHLTNRLKLIFLLLNKLNENPDTKTASR